MRVPVMVEHPAITKAAEHHGEMVRQRDEANAALRKAERGRQSAVSADADAYAQAIASGSKDPGEKRTAESDAAIHQARRRVAALDMAVAAAEAAIETAVRENRDAITATLANRLTTVDRAYMEAVDKWEAAASARSDVLSAIEWLARGDLARPAPGVGGWVPGLRSRRMGSGDAAAHFPEVARALREVVSPPETGGTPVGVAGSMATFLGV